MALTKADLPEINLAIAGREKKIDECLEDIQEAIMSIDAAEGALKTFKTINLPVAIREGDENTKNHLIAAIDHSYPAYIEKKTRFRDSLILELAEHIDKCEFFLNIRRRLESSSQK